MHIYISGFSSPTFIGWFGFFQYLLEKQSVFKVHLNIWCGEIEVGDRDVITVLLSVYLACIVSFYLKSNAHFTLEF